MERLGEGAWPFAIWGRGWLRGSIGGWAYEMDGLSPLVDCVRDQTAVKGGKFAAVGDCEGEQVAVGDLARSQQAVWVDSSLIKQADVVWPELVARIIDETGQQRGYDGRAAGRIGVTRIPDNANQSVFRKRARRPGLTAYRSKPGLRFLMMHIGGIDQGDQYIYVQQIGHGVSSISSLIKSSVADFAPGCMGSNGTPFR